MLWRWTPLDPRGRYTRNPKSVTQPLPGRRPNVSEPELKPSTIFNGVGFDSSIGPRGARAGAYDARARWSGLCTAIVKEPTEKLTTADLDHRWRCEATLRAALLALLAVVEPDAPLSEATLVKIGWMSSSSSVVSVKLLPVQPRKLIFLNCSFSKINNR